MRPGRNAAIALLGAFFIGAGLLHFLQGASYVRIVPPWLPAPALLVQVSGACEVLGGLGILVPQTRCAAGYGLVALLVAVFPANVHMALHPRDFAGLARPWMLYARLPLQPAIIWWVVWASRR